MTNTRRMTRSLETRVGVDGTCSTSQRKDEFIKRKPLNKKRKSQPRDDQHRLHFINGQKKQESTSSPCPVTSNYFFQYKSLRNKKDEVRCLETCIFIMGLFLIGVF